MARSRRAGRGGVTADIVRALGIDDLAWLPADAAAPPEDPRLAVGRSLRLAALTRDPAWRGLNNGLGEDENRRLATTDRPSELRLSVSASAVDLPGSSLALRVAAGMAPALGVSAGAWP